MQATPAFFQITCYYWLTTPRRPGVYKMSTSDKYCLVNN